VHTGDYS